MRKALFAAAMATLLFASQAQAGFGIKRSDDALKRATAKELNVLSENVAVSNKQNGPTWYKWDATTPDGSFKCEATDMLKDVNCVRVVAVAEAKEQ